MLTYFLVSMDELEELKRKAEARVGSVLKGKWTLDKLLGVGGTASVYAATHRNKKRVAIKMLHPSVSSDADVRQRFLREGYVANSVDHKGTVTVDDDDVTEEGQAFLVLELLDGETLEARWRRKQKRLSAREALPLIDQLLDTLAAAHQAGVVHRDIKPENVFVTRAGVVKVLDFGIARLREVAGARSTTAQGYIMGTPGFMAPEQAAGWWERVDARTDLWSVGASLFTLLTGKFVHDGDTVHQALAAAITQPAPELLSVEPDADPALAKFVDRALASEPEHRFPDARSMQEALRSAYKSVTGDEIVRAPQPSFEGVPLSIPPSQPPEPAAEAEPKAKARRKAKGAEKLTRREGRARVEPEEAVSGKHLTTSGVTRSTQVHGPDHRRNVLLVGVLALAVGSGGAYLVLRSPSDGVAPESSGAKTDLPAATPPAAQPASMASSIEVDPADASESEMADVGVVAAEAATAESEAGLAADAAGLDAGPAKLPKMPAYYRNKAAQKPTPATTSAPKSDPWSKRR